MFDPVNPRWKLSRFALIALRDATLAQRRNWKPIGRGHGLHWRGTSSRASWLGKKERPMPIRALLVLPFLLVFASMAHAERIALDQPTLHFDAGALGGIRTILRYDLPAPDRSDTAILFLAAPTEPGSLPSAVQVAGGSEDWRRPLLDSEGGDCTLARVGLYRAGRAVAVVEAVRHWTHGGPSLADPDAMEVRVYQLGPSSLPGESNPVFRLQGAPTLTRPLCALKDVDAAIDAAARSWRPSAVTTPQR